MKPRRSISARGRITPYSLEELCQRVGMPYAPDLALAAVLAEATRRAGIAAPVAERKLAEMGGGR